MKVLVAEDDENIRNGLTTILKEEGYQTVGAADGDQALELFRTECPDFICLDIMMPGKNGYDVCKSIRQDNGLIPIIFISAKSEEIDRVIGLELGADDFIMKPFGVKEVIARIRAVTRRCLRQQPNQNTQNRFQFGDLSVVPNELRALRGEQLIELSYREMSILQLFYRHKGQVLDRDALFNACWGMDYFPNSRTLDQHISKLRKNIEIDSKNPVLIQTVHGRGYRYNG
jgi:DNA-binding response OmpR family regulator